MKYFVTHEANPENGRRFMPFARLVDAKMFAQEKATAAGRTIGIHEIEAQGAEAAVAGIEMGDGEQIDVVSPKRTEAEIEASRRKEARRQFNEL